MTRSDNDHDSRADMRLVDFSRTDHHVQRYQYGELFELHQGFKSMPTYIWNVMITYDVIFGSSVKDSSRRTVEERLRLAVAGSVGVSRHRAKMLSHFGNGRGDEWLKRWRL